MTSEKEQTTPRHLLEIILSFIAIILITSIFLKAIIDLDTNYDTGWYHLLFSARIWGIVPKEIFTSGNVVEDRFVGFPLLAHFFQGLLWKVTGRIQAANLVGYSSLIIYFVFLRSYFKVPLYLSAIAILTIPAVLTHATTGFVDLPGNVGVSVLVMMTYLFYRRSQLPTKQELLIAFLGAAAAVNIKPQLQPLVFIIYCLVGIRLIWLYVKHNDSANRHLVKIVPIAILASVLIFATPIKNVALYGNPFYPIKIQVAGIVLNHKATPKTYDEGNRPQKWLQSVLEINTPSWSADQWNRGDTRYMDRGGGFFGAYVIFNLLLLLVLVVREQLQNKQLSPKERSRKAKAALATVILMSLIPANFPQSHELRYFMFWMICLVSLNLHLISVSRQNASNWRWLQPRYIGLVSLLFLVIVLSKIGGFYAKPVFYSLEDHLSSVAVKPELLNQMKANEKICLISKHSVVDPAKVPFASIASAFYYSSYFYPDLNYDYSIKAAPESQECGDRKIIPANIN